MSRDCRNVLLLLGAAASLACGDDDATFEGGGSAAEATSSSADTTSTSAAVDSSEGALDESTESTSSSSTGPSDIPYPEACEAPEATIEVAAATTPEGPIEIDEAWVGSDYCGGSPFVELVQLPSRETGGEVSVIVFVDELEDEYFGPYPATIWGWIPQVAGTIELLEPFPRSETGVPNPDAHLHAQIEFHEGGWDLSLEVDLIDCGVTQCFCPCR